MLKMLKHLKSISVIPRDNLDVFFLDILTLEDGTDT
jgi:hypothetical protein